MVLGMSAQTAAAAIAEGLELHDVRYVFGIPGAKIDAVFDALEDRSPQVIVCRHEQNAAFMAAAVGRLTGRPGVCIATSGPGGSNLVTGLATATTEGDPVVALVGAVPRRDLLKRTHQSMSTTNMFATVAKWSVQVDDPEDVPEVLARAFRIATADPPGAVVVALPQDVQAAVIETPAIGWHPPPSLGPAPKEAIEEAARLITDAKRPALLIGVRGSRPAEAAELHELLSRFPIPTAESFQGSGSVAGLPDSVFVGRVGLFRNQPGDRILAHADVVVTIGYDPVEYDPPFWNHGEPKSIVHIDSLPANWDNDYQPAVELQGGIPATLAALTSSLVARPLSADQRSTISTIRSQRLASLDRELTNAKQCHPLAVVAQLQLAVPKDTVVACDVGSNYIWMARHFHASGPRKLLFSNGQQTLGVALPWAMAANLLGHRAVSVSGDGGFLFSGVELETAVRCGVDLVHVLLRDNAYNMVAFQEELKYGRTSGVTLGHYDLVKFAESFGATGFQVESERDLPTVFAEAFAAKGPVLVDVPVDYSHNTELAEHLIPDDFH